MLVDKEASHSFMSPQMVKSFGLFSMRVDNPIEVRFAKSEPQVARRVVGNVPIEWGMWKWEEVLPSARWTTSMSSWACRFWRPITECLRLRNEN